MDLRFFILKKQKGEPIFLTRLLFQGVKSFELWVWARMSVEHFLEALCFGAEKEAGSKKQIVKDGVIFRPHLFRAGCYSYG